jgi:hypothetical protein
MLLVSLPLLPLLLLLCPLMLAVTALPGWASKQEV